MNGFVRYFKQVKGYSKYLQNYAVDQLVSSRSLSTASQRYTVTLFPGDGIGPEISKAVQDVFAAAELPIDWEVYHVSTKSVKPGEDLIPKEALDAVKRNGYGLKGPLETPIGKGHKSLNLTLRKALSLYANVRPCVSVPGVKTKYENVNVVTVRENTEGEYSGLEHIVYPGVVEMIKLITRQASLRVARYAFEYAKNNQRKMVTAVHKATVMKRADGLFLDCCREVAQQYPNIQYEEMLIDTCAAHLVQNPSRLDVMVMPNLYGDIISDLCAGLIGGLGLTPSGNMGEACMLAEAVHGTAPDIAGKNAANPTALLLSSLMMVRQMKLFEKADIIENAIYDVLKEGKVRTRDLGGTATCTDYTLAIVDKIRKSLQ
ncbi:Isocitrate dehydrogenase [NAD] catalytic subunit 5, mitochondrial [Galdieria sulphuraria]|uniref:Isocitrate dehydrogenase (NAD+) n=1 Tax=Galdieria sulphuraria TaxID=130081 RepID=M2XU59_GALSU|nr:isocitrate dehydrogenase (NAD+) [Galdieria sulphuraria]EME26939.1 isocitrate dehydrogenase (NAD+) [Galdieria sulphuraria]GJD10593.1 Isocitrate dehydrogenase [NAD] catalytic subunit 5, mitochondrial [Galdieria sulphuraria]|eukprot:XP_005703459.1 isocitrate dehydrogenase (NAD+) [Galdieria sulphuraria]